MAVGLVMTGATSLLHKMTYQVISEFIGDVDAPVGSEITNWLQQVCKFIVFRIDGHRGGIHKAI